MCIEWTFARVTALKAAVYVLFIVISTKALAEERESTCINRNDAYNYILPKSVKPIQYVIILKIHIPKHFNFEGNVDILLQIQEETKCIVLHAVNLKILGVTITIENNTINVKHSKDEKRQLLILSVQESLLKGKECNVSISYIGSLATGEDKLGFYKHEYLEHIGPHETKSRWSAITHFQPTYARKAFPCFDEPEYKAKFNISIVIPPEYQALSNMPPDGEPKEVKNGYKYYKFQETAIMSTYVIALMVIDLSFKSLKDGKKPYKYSTWTRSNIIKHAWYSENIGPKILEYFEKYLGIKYAFPKMDQIAIPHFQSKTLQNWGLMIFNEYFLVLDDHQYEYKNEDKAQYDSDELRIAKVVGHEIAHQWFGNLVTLKWWNNAWLNEAFATYFEHMALAVVHKELYVKETFLLDYQLYSMVFDSDVSARSLDADVITPSEIDSKFDVISHQKGASILKMFRDVITERTFQKALSRYLQKWKYKNTVPEDLYNALEEEWQNDKHTDAKIYHFFRSWVTNPGYPIVYVRRVEGNLFEVRQERFILGQQQVLRSVFWIPLTWTTEYEAPAGFKKTQPFSWLTPDNETKRIKINNVKESDWIIFNNQASGYYRVMYDEKLWLLIRQLVESRPEILNVLNRMQIIDDVHALAKLRKLPYSIALNIGNLLENEVNIYPWKAGMISYGYIERRFLGGRGYAAFKCYMRKLITNLYKKFGFEEKKTDSQNTRRNRAWVLKWACYFEYKDCVRKAMDMYTSYQETNKLIPSYMRSVVFCTAIRNGENENWILMWRKIKELKKSKPYNEQYEMLSALGCTKNLEILDKFLRKTITSNNVMQKEIPNAIIASMARYQEGIYLVSKWLARSLKNMSLKFGETPTADNIVAVSRFVNTKEDLYRLETLVNMSIKQFRRPPTFVYKQALESAKTNLNWNYYFKHEVQEWLEMKNKEDLTNKMKISRAYLGLPKQKISTVNYVILYMITMNYWYGI